MEHIFFGGWQPVARTAIIGVLAYICLVIILRISGRRTLSKMNAFDFVVTVALGSTLATILLSKDVSLVQGVVALALLIGMQYIVTWFSARTDWVRDVVTGEPALLFYQGSYLQESMKKARVARNDIQSAVRGAGHEAMNDITAVVLETDGSFSVVKSDGSGSQSSLAKLVARHDKQHSEQKSS